MIDWDEPWLAYKLRWRRRKLLWRALRRRRQLSCIVDRTHLIQKRSLLCFATVRNEAQRLPYWLEHHRKLGIEHFLIVENASTDETAAFLKEQPDVSIWATSASYKASRFGVDWINWLMARYGHRHWCLTLDADELFIMPYSDTRCLRALTMWLDQEGQRSFPAMMLDLYPQGPVEDAHYAPGTDPVSALPYFDGHNYIITKQAKLQNLWIQGGVRARHFFHSDPRRAPTLSKVPLVKWNRRFAYVSSTHSLLPRRLNRVYDEGEGEAISGILLHTKFLNTIVEKSAEEKQRREHFENSDLYDGYYDALTENPTLWHPKSTRFVSWRQLEAMGLMSRGKWL